MSTLATLKPVLAALLASECSATCSLLIRHLEDRLLVLLGRCLNALLRPWGKRIIKLKSGEREALRQVLKPYKREVLLLSQRNVTATKKRKILDQALRKHPEFHEILAGIAKTLHGKIEADFKENGKTKSQ